MKRSVKNIASPKKSKKREFFSGPSQFKQAIVKKSQNDLSDALGLGFEQAPSNFAPSLNQNSLFFNTDDLLLTYNPWLLTNCYRQHGVLQSVIDVPVNDAFRGDVKFVSDTISPDEMDLLKKTMKDAGDWERISSTMRWGRLFGAGELFAFTQQKPSEEMIPEKLYGKKLEFYSTDRWEAPSDNPRYAAEGNFLFHDQMFHPSRVFLYTGREQPYYIRIRLQGYGCSVLEQVIPPVLDYLKSQTVILELLDEAKIDVLKIFDLSKTLLSKEGAAKVRKRVNIAAQNKDYKSMLTIDSQDDYMQKQLTFSGIAEVMKEIRFLFACAAKMPVSKLFGIGATGFSSGEDDLENYNAMVENDVRFYANKIIKFVTKLRCYQLFGREVEDLEAKWKPLRILSDEQEATVNTQKVNALLQLQNAGNLLRSETMRILKDEEVVTQDTEALEGKNDEMVSLDDEKEFEDDEK